MRRILWVQMLALLGALLLPVSSMGDVIRARPGTGFSFQTDDGSGYAERFNVTSAGVGVFTGGVEFPATGIQFSGNGTFLKSGNHSLTLTTTAATNITLPTTGTLATLAGIETLTNKSLSGGTLSGTIAGTPTWSAINTYSAGIKITGGTAATENIARTAAGTLDINNSSLIVSGTEIIAGRFTYFGSIGNTNFSRTPSGFYQLLSGVSGGAAADTYIRERADSLNMIIHPMRFNNSSLSGGGGFGIASVPAGTIGTSYTLTSSDWIAGFGASAITLAKPVYQSGAGTNGINHFKFGATSSGVLATKYSSGGVVLTSNAQSASTTADSWQSITAGTNIGSVAQYMGLDSASTNAWELRARTTATTTATAGFATYFNTPIIAATYAGAVTIGPASFAGQHKLNGNLETAGGGTFEYIATPTTTSIIGGLHGSISLRNTGTATSYWLTQAGLKANSSGQSVPSIANVSGSYLQGIPTSTTTGVALDFRTLDSNSHTAGQTGLSLTSKFSITQAGAVTIGPTSGGVTHTVNGALVLDYSGAPLSNGLNTGNKISATFTTALGNVDYFTGGVAGQIFIVSGSSAGASVTFRHNTGATGQKFLLPGGASHTITGGYGGAIFVCDGTFWILVGHTN